MIFVLQYQKVINMNIEMIETLKKLENVQVVAVSKTRTKEEIDEVAKLGLTTFGENKVQEFVEKYDPKYKWHIIGHLQTNKVKYIAGRVDMIESVDSLKLAREISKEFKKANSTANVLVEVNIGREESKSGCDIDELEELLYQISELDCIKVKGLMTIPPICDELQARKYFALMNKKFLELKEKKIDGVEMQTLSMGMSADYEAAILEGSNIVRVGSAIFGARKYF